MSATSSDTRSSGRTISDLPGELANVHILGDRILVEAKEENVSSGGILLPEGTAKEKICSGKVVMLGSGRFNKDGTGYAPMFDVIKSGNIVFYNKWSASEFQNLKGIKYVLVKHDDVVAAKDSE